MHGTKSNTLQSLDYIDYTPKKPMQQKFYKYYCPLCMNYFSTMQKSSCCNNYICHYCAKNLSSSTHCSCPYCSKQGFSFQIVGQDEKVRIYLDEQELNNFPDDLVHLDSFLSSIVNLNSTHVSRKRTCSSSNLQFLHESTKTQSGSNENKIFIDFENLQKVRPKTCPASIRTKNKRLSNRIVPIETTNIFPSEMVSKKRKLNLLSCLKVS